MTFFFPPIFMMENPGGCKAQRRFPGTGRAGDHYAPALWKGKREVAQGFLRRMGVDVTYVFEFNHSCPLDSTRLEGM